MMVSTTAGGRPLKFATSRPGATHGGSIDLDADAIWCRAPEKGGPSSEECAREVLSRGKWVQKTRSGWANGAQQAGPAPRPPWACTVSVWVGSLGETQTCVRPEASCVPVRICRGGPRSGRSTAGSGRTRWRQTGLHELPRIDSRSAGSSRDGVATLRGTWAVVRARRPHDWAAPGCEQHCVWLQRRRWRASCDMRCDRIPPSRLIYETAAVLPNSSGRNCRKAKCTAHSSRQLMWQSSRGPVQSPEGACLLHVAPQPVLEASVVTTVCRDTCSRGSPAHRKARSVQGLREQRHCWEIAAGRYRGAMPTSGPGSVASAEVVSYEAIRAAWLQLRMPYAPGASETVSVVPHSCLWRNSGSSALLGHVPLWGVPSYSPSLTPHREKRFSAQGRAYSSWPEAPTGWGAGGPSPCDRPTALWIGLG